MTVKYIDNLWLAYVILPYKRNQDVVAVSTDCQEAKFVASVVDGWNWAEKVAGNQSGRLVA